MRLTKLDIVDWEPCIVRFAFAPGNITPGEFRDFVDEWLKATSRSATCRCQYRYSEFSTNGERGTETLRTEWMCEDCAGMLANAVERKFPSLRKVELGLRASPENTASAVFKEVPAKEVEFEDGSRIAVGPFSISQHPVKVSEFENFVRSTGYVTLAEQRQCTDTFRSHCGLSGLSPLVRMGAAVQLVTLADANAFCQHVGHRLPTEAEWLAAAVIEAGEVELTPWEELQRKVRNSQGNALSVKYWDITATSLPDGRVVTRRGPVDFLQKGWREQPLLNFNRRLINADSFDISITFRLVADAK